MAEYIFVSALFVAYLAGYASDTAHMLAVPGSALRYKAATAFYATGWAVVAEPAVFGIGSAVSGRPGFAVFCSAFAAYGVWMWKRFLERDDGDNWFTRTGRKLRRKIAAMLPSPAPSPA